jgi:acyl-CoA thioester hydrolase
MARLEIQLPEKFLFETALTVRVTDLNYGNHVGNDTILSYMHEIRLQFYQSIGYRNELNFEGDIGQIITDAAIVYKSESFLGDVLIGKIAVNDFNKYGFDFFYLITNNESGKEVARGKTGVVCFDYSKRKVASVPQSLLAKLQSVL